MNQGRYLTTEGWKPCQIKDEVIIYGTRYMVIIDHNGNEQILIPWKVTEASRANK